MKTFEIWWKDSLDGIPSATYTQAETKTQAIKEAVQIIKDDHKVTNPIIIKTEEINNG